MFDLLSQVELDALSDKLCNAIFDLRYTGYLAPDMLCELRILEHDVWHVRCERSGIRCPYRHNQEARVA